MIHILLSRSILNQPHIYEKAKAYIKSTDKVAVLAFSFFPKDYPSQESYDMDYEKGGEYYEKIVTSFIPYGILEHQISFIHYDKDNHDSAIQKLKASDIIYFPGGAPDLMMERIRAFDLVNTLESHDKVFIGSSAGAMIQVKHYHIAKDFDYSRFSYEEGLNLISNLSIEVHYRRKKVQKRATKKVWRAYRHDIYGIPDDGMMIIDHHEVKLIHSALQLYNHKGVIK
jgi:peptidase E